jgi:hypothetical protein
MKKTVISLVLALMLLCTFSVAASAQAMPGEEATIVQPNDTAQPGQAEAPDMAETTEAPEHEKSNTPYFIGAGIALVLFAGVAVYCKSNGSKTF